MKHKNFCWKVKKVRKIAYHLPIPPSAEMSTSDWATHVFGMCQDGCSFEEPKIKNTRDEALHKFFVLEASSYPVHTTEQSAVEEAEILARSHPESTYLVLVETLSVNAILKVDYHRSPTYCQCDKSLKEEKD